MATRQFANYDFFTNAMARWHMACNTERPGWARSGFQRPPNHLKLHTMKTLRISLLLAGLMFLATAQAQIQTTYSTNALGQTVERDQFGNTKAVYSKDALGNTVKRDAFGNTQATYRQDALGRTVERDAYGNTTATYSKDALGNTVKRDAYGNTQAVFRKDALGNTVKTDAIGNRKGTFRQNALGDIQFSPW